MPAPNQPVSLSGYFELLEADPKMPGWAQCIRVVDTDGMPFVIDDMFKEFIGKGVKITVEIDPTVDQRADSFRDRHHPLVYELSGFTERDYERRKKK